MAIPPVRPSVTRVNCIKMAERKFFHYLIGPSFWLDYNSRDIEFFVGDYLIFWCAFSPVKHEMKLLSINNIHIFRECQQMFHFELPSEQLEKKEDSLLMIAVCLLEIVH